MDKVENLYKELIDKMFEIAGHDLKYEDVLGEKQGHDWYQKYTMTPEQHEEWKKFSIPLIRKSLKCSIKKAEAEFNWFDFGCGLKVENKG